MSARVYLTKKAKMLMSISSLSDWTVRYPGLCSFKQQTLAIPWFSGVVAPDFPDTGAAVIEGGTVWGIYLKRLKFTYSQAR